jgi:hypothetical protein
MRPRRKDNRTWLLQRLSDRFEGGKVILWALFIEIHEINAHALFISIFLRHQHWIGNPSRIHNLADELCVLQSMKLF